VVFGATWSGYATAQDIRDGIIDRFRTLPMRPSAVLVGRTNGDLLINSISMVVMILTGLVVGWRIHTSLLEALAGVALLLGFAYALSWVMVFIGLTVRSPEIINNVSFIVLFPLTFISNAFVPSENLPEPLKTFAEWNPVSALVLAARTLFGNIPPGMDTGDTWPLQHPIWAVLIGIGVMLAIFVPLSIRRFGRIGSRP
jgi:ABC-2 type transport system permease protein